IESPLAEEQWQTMKILMTVTGKSELFQTSAKKQEWTTDEITDVMNVRKDLKNKNKDETSKSIYGREDLKKEWLRYITHLFHDDGAQPQTQTIIEAELPIMVSEVEIVALALQDIPTRGQSSANQVLLHKDLNTAGSSRYNEEAYAHEDEAPNQPFGDFSSSYEPSEKMIQIVIVHQVVNNLKLLNLLLK
ncbi:hypothetical protein ILUMI_18812, partial [Ignelater luminosus]